MHSLQFGLTFIGNSSLLNVLVKVKKFSVKEEKKETISYLNSGGHVPRRAETTSVG